MNPHRSHGPQDNLPDCGGCYTLVIILPKQRSIRVGRLGKALFPAGTYFYTGSAMRSLRGRIARHIRKRKKPHWHIDYLLNSPDALVKEVAIHIFSTHQECRYNKEIARLPGAKVVLPGFGSSDCLAGCLSHLIHLRSTRARKVSKGLIGQLKGSVLISILQTAQLRVRLKPVHHMAGGADSGWGLRFPKRKGQVAVAICAIALGASLVVAAINLRYGIRGKLAQELRSYGANLVLVPRTEPFLKESDLVTLEDPRDRMMGYAPFLHHVATVEGRDIVLAGTQFSQVKEISQWWQVEGKWPDKEDEALIGTNAAYKLALRLDDLFSVAYKTSQLSLSVAGFLRTGGSEEHQVFVGLIFQQFYLIPYLTALENVMLAQYFCSIADREEAAQALHEVGLGGRMSHYPSELSGGEQQRVCISRALINQPKILLADEPTGNLDAENEEIVMGIFRCLHRAGLALLFVTHDPQIGTQADRIIELEHSRILPSFRTRQRASTL